MADIDEVAARARVSKSTVSRAFSRPEAVRADTRERVLAAARELGYQPSRVARSLARGATGTLGLFVPDIANPFFPPIIKAVQAQARRHDLALFVADSDEHAEEERSAVRAMARQVDGIVLASPRMSDADVRSVLELVPVVVINRHVSGAPTVLTSTDGLAQAAEHLAALGHRQILFLAGPERSYSNLVRREALRTAAARLDVELVELGPFQPTFESGVRAGDLVIARAGTAVIAYNDLIALGLMARLDERGVAVGSEVSVVGIDDVWLAPMSNPPLTTVHIPGADAGTVAVRLLVDVIANGLDDSREPTVLPSELIVRRSTSPVRAGREAA